MFERMLEKDKKPSLDELAGYCGENGARFRALNDHLSAQYATTQEIRFPYGNRYGWCVTHRKGKKLICDVFAEAGAFTVMLRLSDRQFAAVSPVLQADTQREIDNRYPCGDGGWLHYRVTDDQRQRDIERLLREKCE